MLCYTTESDKCSDSVISSVTEILTMHLQYNHSLLFDSHVKNGSIHSVQDNCSQHEIPMYEQSFLLPECPRGIIVEQTSLLQLIAISSLPKSTTTIVFFPFYI